MARRGGGGRSVWPPDDESVERKLDLTLRRLLGLSDAKIRRMVESHEKRRDEQREKLQKDLDRLPPTASEADRDAIRRAARLKSSELIPRRLIHPVVKGRLRPVRIRAIVHFTGNRQDLEALGIQVRTQAQDIFTIVGTRRQLADLAALPACLRLQAPRAFGRSVENACAQAEITDVHVARPTNPAGYQGTGVIVGVIDSALDVTHHGFREPAAPHGTRVLHYWVQEPYTLNAWGNPVTAANPPGQTPQQFTNANPGTSPNFAGLNYGRHYSAADIDTAIGLANPFGDGNNQICCEPGLSEHGTHCAGIAAGNGHEANWATPVTHEGAAPRADIVYVSLDLLSGEIDVGGTLEDAILDAIDFILRAAAFHNRPAVISVSQGGSTGPHNGATLFDQARDNLINSFNNRSLVWSAGNDNNDDGYRQGDVPAGATRTFDLTANRRLLWLEIWYEGPELDYRIDFGGANSGWRTAGQDYVGVVGGQDIEADRDAEQVPGLRSIRMYFDDADAGDTYKIRLRNPHASQDVDYWAWAGLQGWWGDLTGSVQDEMTLSDTGCGKAILTVGACSKLFPANPASDEQITGYSAAGPTLDGRIKPEIVAVGGTLASPIISANSDQNSGYVGMFGTSMATPLVAGSVALLLEEYNGLGTPLNQDSIKALLIQHANQLNLNLDPGQPGYVATERNLYGYGRLRMIGPIDQIQPPMDVDLWVRTADDDYGDEPYPGGCFCHAPDVRVFAAGTNNETTQINWGTTYDVRVTVRNLGDTQAQNATVRLKYTLPHASPDAWFEAENASNQKLVQTVTVPAMDELEVLFSWRPEAAEIGAPAGTHHFCLLAEVDHANDPLVYPAPTTAGGTAWTTNIKSTNNVALRNLHIQ